ncbi:hypothetical protein B0H13DRAFT_2134984 [Mycena leptocephala]|nr:hypothetical protein B0H13DRAFT_2134984 [Mycena leptocephala]
MNTLAPLRSGSAPRVGGYDTALPQRPRRPRAAGVQRCHVSFLRLVLGHSLFPALARRWGIRKARKVARFGEQGYAVVYFLVVG